METESNQEATGGGGMVAGQLVAIRERMELAAHRSERDPAAVTLVAVSKGHGPEAIMEAYNAGQRHFGENRAGELAAKAPQLPSDIVWHFIGSLQTRQARVAAPHAALLHSLDRERLINTWATQGRGVPALLQVNVAEEPQKHGAAVAEVPDLLQRARDAGVSVCGLMCMPPLVTDPEENRDWFSKLARLRTELESDHPALVELSMGMTDDYEVAIEEGATLIRVGRAIFGAPGQAKD